MRSSPQTAATHAQVPDPFKDERPGAWQPDRISDRKLIELANRLEKVRQLGDAFAGISLSESLQIRLRQLQAASGTVRR
jgi:hypothetical protein